MTAEIVLELFNWFVALMAVAGIVGMICAIALMLIWAYKEIKEAWHER